MISNVGGVSFADYTAAIRNGAKQHVRIAFPNQSAVIEEDHIKLNSLQYEMYMNSEKDFTLDAAPSAHITVSLLNYDGSLSSINYRDEFIVSLGIEINNTIVYQPLGTFIGNKPEKVLVDQIELEGYDRMVLFDISAEDFFMNTSASKTIGGYYEALCTYVGVPYKAIPNTAVNVNRLFSNHPTMGVGVTCKTILLCLAEAMGCYVRIAKDGEVELVWFGDHTSEYIASKTDIFGIDVAEYMVEQIDKLQVKVTDNDIGVIVPADSTEPNCYTIVDNPFLYGDSDADIRPWATNLYNKIHAMGEYRPMNVELDGTWLIEPGDIISVETADNVFQDLWIFNTVIRWNGFATITYECTGNVNRGEMTKANRRLIENAAKYHEVIVDIDQLFSEIGDRHGHTSTLTQEIDGLESRIASLGYGTIYMQYDEPDHSELVQGDMWIQSQSITMWGDIKNTYTWGDTKMMAWQSLGGVPRVWVWDGIAWQELYDAELPANLETRITQTEEAITLLATKEELDVTNGQVSGLYAELDIQAGQITSIAEATNAKPQTYVQWDDPTQTYEIHIGDMWIKKAEDFATWGEAKDSIWQEIKSKYEWGDSVGNATYVWGGQQWILTSDRASEIWQKTEIEQTNTRIQLLATEQATIEGQVHENTTRITQTAGEVSILATSQGVIEGQVETHSTLIAQNSSNILLCATTDGVRSAGSVVTSGSYIRIQEKQIVLASGGEIVCQANQIKIGTSTLANELSGIDDELDSLSDGISTLDDNLSALDDRVDGVSSVANSASSTATSAENLATAIRDGGTKAFYAYNINNTGITINDTSLVITAQGNMTVASGGRMVLVNSNQNNVVAMDYSGIAIKANGKISLDSTASIELKSGNNNIFRMNSTGIILYTGGQLVFGSNNFALDQNGNVALTGTLCTGNWYFDANGALYMISNVSKIGYGIWSGQNINSNGGIFFNVESNGGTIYLLCRYYNPYTERYNSAGYVVFNATSTGGSLYVVEQTPGTITLGNSQYLWYKIFTHDIRGASKIELYPNNSNNGYWMFDFIDNNHIVLNAYGTSYSSIGQSSRFISNGYFTDLYYVTLHESSSREVKHDIKPIGDMDDAIRRLTPVRFKYNNDETERERFGLIWEDTVDIIPELCFESEEGEKTISYTELIPALLKEIQDMRAEIDRLKSTVA